jgi:hypothetical protein
MPTAYESLYAWIHAVFGQATFAIASFRETFPSPAPAKVLSDLVRLGYLESMGVGRFRLISPERRVKAFVEPEEDPFGLPARSRLPHAYCDATAVTVWTDGGYWTGFTRGFRPLHLRVRRTDLSAWKAFFRASGARAVVAGARETLFGVVHVLHPVTRVRSVDHGGVRVVPLREAYEYAAARPYLYEPVIATLRAALGGADA